MNTHTHSLTCFHPLFCQSCCRRKRRGEDREEGKGWLPFALLLRPAPSAARDGSVGKFAGWITMTELPLPKPMWPELFLLLTHDAAHVVYVAETASKKVCVCVRGLAPEESLPVYRSMHHVIDQIQSFSRCVYTLQYYRFVVYSVISSPGGLHG